MRREADILERFRIKRPRRGAERILKRFLVIPTCIQGEWRWLETAYIRQISRGYWDIACGDYYEWCNSEWVGGGAYERFCEGLEEVL